MIELVIISTFGESTHFEITHKYLNCMQSLFLHQPLFWGSCGLHFPMGHHLHDSLVLSLIATHRLNSLYMPAVTCLNSLPTNDGKCRHDLCELSISLWEFIWGF